MEIAHNYAECVNCTLKPCNKCKNLCTCGFYSTKRDKIRSHINQYKSKSIDTPIIYPSISNLDFENEEDLSGVIIIL